MSPSKTAIEVTCIECRQPKLLVVPVDGYNRWKNGALIQDALPLLSADDRELLISHICGPCFDKLFDEGD